MVCIFWICIFDIKIWNYYKYVWGSCCKFNIILDLFILFYGYKIILLIKNVDVCRYLFYGFCLKFYILLMC